MQSIFIKHNKIILDLTWSTNTGVIFVRTCLRYLYIFILALLLNGWGCEENVYCGTAANSLAPHTQTIQEYINEMNMRELGILNDHLGFNQRDFAIWQDLQNQGAANNSNRIGWTSVGLFLVGTAILFLYARYGTEIKDFLFDLGRGTINAVAQGTIGLIDFARETGQVPLVRRFLGEQVQQLLNDPETASKVVNAMRHVHEYRKTVKQ